MENKEPTNVPDEPATQRLTSLVKKPAAGKMKFKPTVPVRRKKVEPDANAAVAVRPTSCLYGFD
jgi:hypothetical protein